VLSTRGSVVDVKGTKNLFKTHAITETKKIPSDLIRFVADDFLKSLALGGALD
jgi:hypothetical protein